MSIKRIFLLCCLTPTLFFFTSCSSDANLDTDETDEIALNSTLFEVEIDGASFKADRISVDRNESLLHIVGTDSKTNRSVFLTFVLKENIQVLGDAKENPSGNIAGYLLNDENVGYLTNALNGRMGEIRIGNLDRTTNTISGTFFFTAHNSDFVPVQLKNGVFENVAFE